MQRRESGFSLSELLAVLGVAGLLASAAVPSYQIVISNSQMRTTADELHFALLHARSEAAKRGRPVALTSDGGADWSAGWTMFEDTDGDGTKDPGEPEVRRNGGMRPNVQLSGTVSSVRFQPSGTLNISPTVVTFTVCHQSRSGESGRQVVITQTGRPTITTMVCA